MLFTERGDIVRELATADHGVLMDQDGPDATRTGRCRRRTEKKQLSTAVATGACYAQRCIRAC
jgi:hypothetical protein